MKRGLFKRTYHKNCNPLMWLSSDQWSNVVKFFYSTTLTLSIRKKRKKREFSFSFVTTYSRGERFALLFIALFSASWHALMCFVQWKWGGWTWRNPLSSIDLGFWQVSLHGSIAPSILGELRYTPSVNLGWNLWNLPSLEKKCWITSIKNSEVMSTLLGNKLASL